MSQSDATDTPYTGQDIYCDEIIPGRKPVKIFVETPNILAFHHTRPYWPVHVVVIPKQHIRSLLEIGEHPEILAELMQVISQVARGVVDQHGAAAVTTNLGNYQDSKHLHWHVHYGAPLNQT